jgi:hypothetical protein
LAGCLGTGKPRPSRMRERGEYSGVEFSDPTFFRKRKSEKLGPSEVRGRQGFRGFQ